MPVITPHERTNRMSEQTWTKEPWEAMYHGNPSRMIPITDENTVPIAYAGVKNRPNDANAARIVACVNYCAGIPTDVLTNYSPPAPVSDVVEAAREACDVVEAAREACDVVEAAREALIALNYARRFGSQGDIDFDENAGKSVSAYIDRAIDHLTAALSRHDAGGGQG
jgi:hypothetical protein